MIDGKKVLLVLGGIPVLNEIIIKAKNKGYYVIATDYLKKSATKDLADEQWYLSIDDVDGIVEACKRRHVDGVMNYCLDPGQKPYQQICEKLGCPCVASFEQFDIMTNKDKFGEACIKNGVGTIPTFNVNEIDSFEYPVMIKPVDSRASKGLVVCKEKSEVKGAIDYALSFSKRKTLRVEKFLKVFLLFPFVTILL